MNSGSITNNLLPEQVTVTSMVKYLFIWVVGTVVSAPAGTICNSNGVLLSISLISVTILERLTRLCEHSVCVAESVGSLVKNF